LQGFYEENIILFMKGIKILLISPDLSEEMLKRILW